MAIFVCSSVSHSLIRTLNINLSIYHLSLIRYPSAYFVGQTEPKILRLVMKRVACPHFELLQFT